MKYKVRESGELTREIEVPFVVEDGWTFEGKEIYGSVSNKSVGQGVFYVKSSESC